jgi:hypothetical protein
MDHDLSSSRPEAPKPPPYQTQPTHTSTNSGTDPASRRVRVYERPNRTLMENKSVMGMILLLVAIALAVYFFFVFFSQ